MELNGSKGTSSSIKTGGIMQNTLEVAAESLSDEDEKIILCVLFKNGKIAASYFKIYEKMLYVLNEIVDLPPQYAATRALLREISPFHIITIGSPCDHFIKLLIEIVNNQDTTIESDQLPIVPNNLSLLTFKEYSFNSCEYRVKSLRLLSEPETLNEDEHELFLLSLINFQAKLSIYSLGTLIKFVEKSWTHLKGADQDSLSFHHVNQISLNNHVLIDRITFNALQVFQLMTHDASFKHGRLSTAREGVSLFRLFSQYCKSKIGCFELRCLMMQPINNKNELNKRLDFIEFAQQSKNQGFIDILQENIKNVVDLNMILGKIQHSRGSRSDWNTLYKTIYHILFLNEFCSPYVNESQIIMEFTKSISDDLYGLERCMYNTFDFKTKTGPKTRPIIKEGLDSDLDRNKLIRDDINERVNATAKVVIDQLPDYINECTVVFIPDMGHVVAIKKWEPDCDPEELRNYGFLFMFELNDNVHYKNALCQELDSHLGEIQTEIINHENRIIERVAAFVLRYNFHIRYPLRIIALMDCLISLSKVAAENGYVRPIFNDNNILEIKDGKHPLLELTNQNYVSNDFNSGGPYPRMKIISGPNASGKTVYLKQTTLLIYLSHIGSFLPASYANISMIHSIHSRMQATESAILNLSAFMIDLTQMAQALHNARSSSLVVMDEFGRGTTGREGMALLIGALRKFLQGNSCPHILLSSHLHIPPEYINLDNSLILYQSMEIIRDPKKNIVFLFKVIEGISSSYALEISGTVSLDNNIILRARDILNSCQKVKAINELPQRFIVQETGIDENFLNDIQIPSVDDDESI